MDALVGLVSRVPARVQIKLLAAFLAIVMLLIMVGAVGLHVLSGVNARTEELIKSPRTDRSHNRRRKARCIFEQPGNRNSPASESGAKFGFICRACPHGLKEQAPPNSIRRRAGLPTRGVVKPNIRPAARRIGGDELKWDFESSRLTSANKRQSVHVALTGVAAVACRNTFVHPERNQRLKVFLISIHAPVLMA